MAIDHVRLEKSIDSLSKALANLNSADDFKKLILIIKRPGWTTPAEYLYALSIVESMHEHAVALTKLRQNLLKASDMVGATKLTAAL